MKLYNECCLTGLSKLKDSKIDMVFMDLPYGITAEEWDKKIDLKQLWVQLNRVVKPNGAIIATCQSFFTFELYNSNPNQYRYSLIWLKNRPTGFASSNKRPLRAHEDILVFYKKQPVYFSKGEPLDKPYTRPLPLKSDNISKTNVINSTKLGEDGKRLIANYTHKTKTTILKFKNPNDKNYGNGTVKPVELVKYLINTYSSPGDTILDPTFGSGTTAIACFETNRNFIGFEKDEIQFQNALNRVKLETF